MGDAKDMGPEVGGDTFGGGEFLVMALAVVEGEGVGFETFLASDGEAGGGIEAAAEEADGAGHELGFLRKSAGEEPADQRQNADSSQGGLKAEVVGDEAGERDED